MLPNSDLVEKEVGLFLLFSSSFVRRHTNASLKMSAAVGLKILAVATNRGLNKYFGNKEIE